MEVAIDEVTVLPRRDPTVAVYAHTARLAYDFADHVLGRLELTGYDGQGGRVGVSLDINRASHRVAWPVDYSDAFPADRPLGDVVWPFVWCH